MSKLNITERRKNSVLILDLDGRIRLGEDCSIFRQALRVLVENGEKKILLNLEKISYVDSSGLGELVSSYTTLQKNNGEVRLLNLSAGVQEVMTLTKLLTIFEVYENEETAVESFEVPSAKAASLGNNTSHQ